MGDGTCGCYEAQDLAPLEERIAKGLADGPFHPGEVLTCGEYEVTFRRYLDWGGEVMAVVMEVACGGQGRMMIVSPWDLCRLG